MPKQRVLRGPTRPLTQRKEEAETRLRLLTRRIERAALDGEIRADRLRLTRRRKV